jgi:hypothetical protein
LLKNVQNFCHFLLQFKGYFSTFFLFFCIRGQLICKWRGFFNTQHTEAAKEGRKVEPFLSRKFFKKMSGQNTTEVFRKHLMTKKVRIQAWQEKGDSATNMANRQGHQGCMSCQKLPKENLAGPSVSSYVLEVHWHHQEWGRHAL